MSEELDTQRLEDEVAKLEEEETTPSDSTTEKTPEETEDSTRTETSLKTAETEETSKKEEEVDSEGIPIRFDKEPSWQRLKRERDDAREKARQFEEFREKVGDLSPDELIRLRDAGTLLRKYPELKNKVQKVIDEHNYGTEGTKQEINTTKEEVTRLRNEMILDKYDREVSRLFSTNKIDKDIQPLVRELLDNRIAKGQYDLPDVPKVFDNTVKDIERMSRRKLASYVQERVKETKIPASPKEKSKIPKEIKESAEAIDVIQEFTEGLRASRSEPIKE